MKKSCVSYRITTYNREKSYPSHTVYALNKGNNSSKPLEAPCPNCFAIVAEDPAQQETIYWCLFAIWKGKMASTYLIGSVIPFLRKQDLANLLDLVLVKVATHPTLLPKAIATAEAAKRAIAHHEAQAAKLKKLQAAYLRSFVAK